MSENRASAIDPLSWIINLPALPRRILATLLLFGTLALIVGLTWSAIATIGEYRSQLEDRRLAAGRLQAVAAVKPLLQHGASQSQSVNENDFFPGETEAVVRAAIQTRLNEIASARGATILSVSNVPLRRIDETAYIGVRADLTGTVDAVHNTIFEIETTKPAFIIREASIWTSGNAQTATPLTPPELSAQLRIYVPLRPDLLPSREAIEQ
ncbi:type II secretion system protein GspM [Nitratireductor sp. ZSWI3]|uniref:type II secretion system protein GspM n=1 Tax=Nitratireductor sp. ZSWI3 TaxID=2966359 RepID=UPI00215064E6|nr:type II secretion system protein GspM [Nitratireductor sp. ZSWI3]MCR4265791.1 type II secretion system protein GspM [Nitratireductor sp. ZSWI3]